MANTARSFARDVLALRAAERDANHTFPEEELKQLLGRGRSKLGMFEGNMEEGELEIGQVAATINGIKTVQEIVDEIIGEYNSMVTKGFEAF